MTWRIIPAYALVAAPWRNGGGTSYDIAGEPGNDVPLWQVSIAVLQQDGPFSHYPHCDRVFTAIAGDPPPELAFHGGPFEPCPLLVPKPFPGDVPTESRIPSPGRAFNAIVDRRRHAVTVQVLAPGPVTLPPALHHVLHCLSGHITLDPGALDPGDSALGHGPAHVAAGTALLVSVR